MRVSRFAYHLAGRVCSAERVHVPFGSHDRSAERGRVSGFTTQRMCLPLGSAFVAVCLPYARHDSAERARVGKARAVGELAR